MKVRVAYTVDASEEYRRAIRMFYGQEGIATREEVVAWHERYGESMDADLSTLADDYYNAHLDDQGGD